MLREIAFDYEDDSNGSAPRPCGSFLQDLRRLDSIKTRSLYPRGSVLFAEGQRPRGVYILCEGRAKVSVTSSAGKTLVLRIADVGDLLGVNAVLAGKPAGATVETLEQCRIDFISSENFLNLLESDKKAYSDVARALSRKLTGVMDHARLLLLSDSAAEKLARLLVKWCDDHGQSTPQGIRIAAGLTHAEIAEMICTSRETVTRLLGELKRKQIVSLMNSAIFIRNRKALESATRF